MKGFRAAAWHYYRDAGEMPTLSAQRAAGTCAQSPLCCSFISSLQTKPLEPLPQRSPHHSLFPCVTTNAK